MGVDNISFLVSVSFSRGLVWCLLPCNACFPGLLSVALWCSYTALLINFPLLEKKAKYIFLKKKSIIEIWYLSFVPQFNKVSSFGNIF